MRTPVLVVPLLAVLSLALAQSVYSAFTIGTIDVDFNGSFASPVSATGAGVIGSAGDSWNAINGTSGTHALNLTTGISSGVSLQISGPAYVAGTSPGANGPNAGLTQDFLAVAGSGNQIKMGNLTLTGLTALQGYQLYLYNGSTSIGRITDFSVQGTATVTGSINNMGGTMGPLTWTPAVAVVPANYLQLNATADSSGKLVIQFMNRAASEGDFAGFQIRAIPEPSTYALFLAGTATLLIVGCRARRRASAK